MARNTSVEAYRAIKINGLLSERRLLVYEILYKYGPMTCSEVVQKALPYVNTPNTGWVPARLGELRKHEVISEVREGPCPTTGRNAIFWDVNSNLPKPLPKKITNKDKLNKIRQICEDSDNSYLRNCILKVLGGVVK